jgi:hypothetical protein
MTRDGLVKVTKESQCDRVGCYDAGRTRVLYKHGHSKMSTKLCPMHLLDLLEHVPADDVISKKAITLP